MLIKDQTVASGAWPEQNNSYSERIATLQVGKSELFKDVL